MKKLIFILTFFFAGLIYPQCNFKTGQYINELDDPSQIIKIEVEIAKSSSYVKNLFKIYTTRSKNIAPKLKKNFKAKIITHYSFGKCDYEAKIRQSGDWKDHIQLKDGQPIRSLDVKLKNGNILNAVGFKLLLPHTRNGLNEVLGSLILKDLGFIAPETFEVNVSVNGTSSVMLFQEKAAKELLERNLKREGPIFEGDESLIWSYKGYEHFELEPISLSRLVNHTWFMKGDSSQSIVLRSYALIQQAYLKYGYQNLYNGTLSGLFPNSISDVTINYNSAMIAMNGKHGLRPHNQKFYFNALDSSFKPVYYDGDLRLDINLELDWIEKLDSMDNILPRAPDDEFIASSLSLNKENKLKRDFLNRVINKDNGDIFFQKALSQYKDNLLYLLSKVENTSLTNSFGKDNVELNHSWYKDFVDLKEVEQTIVEDFEINNGEYFLDLKKDLYQRVTVEDLSKILSKTTFEGKRFVFIPPPENVDAKHKYKELIIENGLIQMSIGINIEIIESKKTINLAQSDPNDWVLIKGADLSSWKITFDGLKPTVFKKETLKQRFNNLGLTGCLTIYNSLINDTFLKVNNGNCEDSLNIINSLGKGLELMVDNAKADAIDADFSDLQINILHVSGAGNDCFDVSGGAYKIDQGILNQCQDKGISIGEKSTLQANNVIVDQANIALSVKDFSRAVVYNIQANNINVCAEVKRKKQEFGGAELSLITQNCSAPFDIDSNSVLLSQIK